MRDLLTRRYQYATDDIPHRDLLDCIDEDGNLLTLLDIPANHGHRVRDANEST